MSIFDPFLISAATRVGAIGVPDAPGIPWVRIAVALFVSIAAAIGIILLLRRLSGQHLQQFLSSKLGALSRKSEIEIIETRRASVNGQICLFHYRGHAYLVAISAGGATLIDKVPVAAEDENIQC